MKTNLFIKIVVCHCMRILIFACLSSVHAQQLFVNTSNLNAYYQTRQLDFLLEMQADNRRSDIWGNNLVQWYVQLYPKNRDYIEVTIDARNIGAPQSGYYLYKVSCEVTFYNDRNRPIATTTINFTDNDEFTRLKPHIYRRYFPCTSSSARLAVGGSLYYKLDKVGRRYKKGPPWLRQKVRESRIEETNDLHIIGSLPPST